MSEDKRDSLDIRCYTEGCEREAVVRWKGVPLCVPHYNERLDRNVHTEPVNIRAGHLEPDLNRHP